MNAALAKVLLILLVLHSCTTGMRFTVTLDALRHGGTPFEIGLMLSTVALFPAFLAVKAGRWLDDKGPRGPLTLAVACTLFAGIETLLLPVDRVGLAPLFTACLSVGFGFLLVNTVTQRLVGDVVRLLTPLLLKVLREWYMIALTFFLSATAFALFPLFENFWLLTATSFLLGLGLGAALPNMMSLVYRLSPAGRIGEAIGLRLMMMNMSKATFPVAMGALGSVIGAGSSLFGLGVLLYGGFAYVLASARAVIGGCEDAARREAEQHE